MLPPIVTIRTATGAAEEATPGLRRPLPPSERAAAIQKILDTLTRHLSGKEILSRDALVRLVEDLALILKFPPLPQETGRAFLRRLTGFLESMPLPERLLLEKQLTARSLAHRFAALTSIPVDRRGALPPDQTPIRSLPLPARAPTSPPPPAAKAPVSSDLALLQAMLRKAYSTDLEDTRLDKAPEGAGQETAPKKPTRTEAQRAPSPSGSALPPAAAEAAEAEAVAGPIQEDAGEVKAAVPQGKEGLPDSADPTVTPPRSRDSEATVLEADAGAEPEHAEPVHGAVEAVAAEEGMGESAETTAGRLDADGTYGPTRAERKDEAPRVLVRDEADGRSARPPTEAVRAIARDSLALPETSKGGQPAEGADSNGTADPVSPGGEAARRPKESATPIRGTGPGAEPPGESASADGAEASLPDMPPSQTKARDAGEDVGTPQALARLVEIGLPREAIPFALVPYPPAPETSEADEMNRREPADEEEAGEDARDGEGDQEGGGETLDHAAEDGSDQDEERTAADAYDLYRKLGGIG